MLIRFINNLSGGRDTCHGDNTTCLFLIWCLQHQSFGRGNHTKEYPEGYYRARRKTAQKQYTDTLLQSLYCSQDNYSLSNCPGNSKRMIIEDARRFLKHEGSSDKWVKTSPRRNSRR
jgi:hypothetical protein